MKKYEVTLFCALSGAFITGIVEAKSERKAKKSVNLDRFTKIISVEEVQGED